MGETREIPSSCGPGLRKTAGILRAESRVVPSREERERFSERLSFSDYSIAAAFVGFVVTNPSLVRNS